MPKYRIKWEEGDEQVVKGEDFIDAWNKAGLPRSVFLACCMTWEEIEEKDNEHSRNV